MTLFLQIVTLLLVLCDLGVHLYREVHHGHIAEDALDAEVERAQKEQKDRIDEGFENIMAYSVRGHNGFERTE